MDRKKLEEECFLSFGDVRSSVAGRMSVSVSGPVRYSVPFLCLLNSSDCVDLLEREGGRVDNVCSVPNCDFHAGTTHDCVRYVDGDVCTSSYGSIIA